MISFPIRKSRWEELLCGFLQQFKIAINSIITTPSHLSEEGLAYALVVVAAPYCLWIAVEFYGLRFGGRQVATRLQNHALTTGHRYAKAARKCVLSNPSRFMSTKNHAQKSLLIGYLIREWETLFEKHPIQPLLEQCSAMCRDLADIVVTYYGWIDASRFNELVAQAKYYSEHLGLNETGT